MAIGSANALAYEWVVTKRDGTVVPQFDQYAREFAEAGERVTGIAPEGLFDNVRSVEWRPRQGVRLPPRFMTRFVATMQDGDIPVLFRRNQAMAIAPNSPPLATYYVGRKYVLSSGDVVVDAVAITPPMKIVVDGRGGGFQDGPAFPGSIESVTDLNQENALVRWLKGSLLEL